MGKRKIKLHSALSQAQKQQRQRKRQKLEEESEKQAQAGPSRPNQEAQRPWIPFDKAQHILLVGEGNFSFAASLARHACQGIGKKLVASAYDSEAIAREKYPDLQEHLDVLHETGAQVLFGIDATALSKSKPLKSLRGTFDRIAFLYPHVGLGEKDQSRNVCLNQKLLLGFFREAAHLLRDGDVPGRSKRRKQDELEDDVSDAEEDKEGSDAAPTERGQMLLVLRTGKPYDLWDVGALAKQGPLVISTLKLSGMKAVSQPTYMQIRSGIFNAEWYPGYEHRRTIGWDERFSTSSNADTQYSAKDRRKTESERGEKVKSRMWSFCVKEKNGT